MDLFGTKKLRKQIKALENEKQQLEEQVDTLQRKLEKADRRKKEAVTAKQEAEKQINQLEDRIHGLEGQLTDDEGDQQGHDTTALTVPGVEHLLDNLATLSFNGSDALTQYTDTEEETTQATFLDPHIVGIQIETPVQLETGTYRSSTFTTQPLRNMLHARYLFIHLSDGGSGIAVIEDTEVQDHETIDADIKAKHGKGGYSQKRFQRIREQQIQEHVKAVMDIYDTFSDTGYEHLILTGNRHLIDTAAAKLDEHTLCSSDVRKIRDEQHLLESFNTALGCSLTHLTPEERKKYSKRA